MQCKWCKMGSRKRQVLCFSIFQVQGVYTEPKFNMHKDTFQSHGILDPDILECNKHHSLFVANKNRL